IRRRIIITGTIGAKNTSSGTKMKKACKRSSIWSRNIAFGGSATGSSGRNFRRTGACCGRTFTSGRRKKPPDASCPACRAACGSERILRAFFEDFKSLVDEGFFLLGVGAGIGSVLQHFREAWPDKDPTIALQAPAPRDRRDLFPRPPAVSG